MILARRQIPAWYGDNWTPAKGRGELPQISWEDLEMAIRDLLPPADHAHAQMLLRTFWLGGATLGPMQQLQHLLLTAAQMFTPSSGRRRGSAMSYTPTPATGPLPRWSYTDLEVALTYNWKGRPLLIGLARHREILGHRGEGCSGAETARQICLLVSGLPLPKPITQRQITLAPASLQAVA